MKTAEDMIKFINKSLKRTCIADRPKSGLKLSAEGEKSVTDRWNKSEASGGYTQSEREMV